MLRNFVNLSYLPINKAESLKHKDQKSAIHEILYFSGHGEAVSNRKMAGSNIKRSLGQNIIAENGQAAKYARVKH